MNEISPFLGTIFGNMIIAGGIILLMSFISIFKKKFINKIDYLTSLTVGLLLGIIFLGFIPEIIEEGNLNAHSFGALILIGLFIFYIFELFFHWHHCKDLGHSHHCDHDHGHAAEHKSNFLMFTGTFVHNAFHGFILFSAFSIDFQFGLITTIAILLHSIPQNIANYIMNHKNPRYSYIAAFGGIFGALITYPFFDLLIQYEFQILTVITGGLLYTALADIFPEFNEKGSTQEKIIYLLIMSLGVFAFLGINTFSGHDHLESNIITETSK